VNLSSKEEKSAWGAARDGMKRYFKVKNQWEIVLK
jgi:hypothetical protein